jgi:Mrp family chromosome partitioning ATPase
MYRIHDRQRIAPAYDPQQILDGAVAGRGGRPSRRPAAARRDVDRRLRGHQKNYSSHMETIRLAIAGKGGSGKTTIAGTLSRLLARQGRAVVAVDADTNPNLATTIGIAADRAKEITSLPRTLMARETLADGTIKTRFAGDPLRVLEDYGAMGPDGVKLVVMGAVGHGGVG